MEYGEGEFHQHHGRRPGPHVGDRQIPAADRGWSPLRRAVEDVDVERVRRLLADDADVTEVDPVDGSSLLHHSIDIEVESAINTDAPLSVALTELLLDAGADPRARNHRGQTALAMAEERGHRLAVELLARPRR